MQKYIYVPESQNTLSVTSNLFSNTILHKVLQLITSCVETVEPKRIFQNFFFSLLSATVVAETLCFHRRLSVHGRGEVYTPLGKHPMDRHPLGRQPSGQTPPR